MASCRNSAGWGALIAGGHHENRAAVFDFGPVIIGLRTTFLVPAASPIKSIPEVDRPGVRIVVPARSAQGEQLDKIITKAALIRVSVETPQPDRPDGQQSGWGCGADAVTVNNDRSSTRSR